MYTAWQRTLVDVGFTRKSRSRNSWLIADGATNWPVIVVWLLLIEPVPGGGAAGREQGSEPQKAFKEVLCVHCRWSSQWTSSMRRVLWNGDDRGALVAVAYAWREMHCTCVWSFVCVKKDSRWMLIDACSGCYYNCHGTFWLDHSSQPSSSAINMLITHPLCLLPPLFLLQFFSSFVYLILLKILLTSTTTSIFYIHMQSQSCWWH